MQPAKQTRRRARLRLDTVGEKISGRKRGFGKGFFKGEIGTHRAATILMAFVQPTSMDIGFLTLYWPASERPSQFGLLCFFFTYSD